tara:strand:- start:594 stop:947 length:354 start_codon:yes stop_codon:yes gene_type:complete
MINITLDNFEAQLMKSEVPCFLKLSRRTCSLCKGLDSVFLRLQAHYGRRMKFSTIDIDEHPEILNIFNIEGVPTIMVFVDGWAEELSYPEDPNFYSGYGESYLRDFINSHIFKNDQK